MHDLKESLTVAALLLVIFLIVLLVIGNVYLIKRLVIFLAICTVCSILTDIIVIFIP